MVEVTPARIQDPSPGIGPRSTNGGGSFAELLDRVVWDYSPRDAEPSPLVSTARFFDEFPWDGETSRTAKSHGDSAAEHA